MLELLVVSAEREAAVLPEAAEGSVQVWREHGEVCAQGYRAEGANWLHLPRVGTYRFTAPNRPVMAIVAPSVSERLVRDGFERTVLPLALQFFGAEALHASGVVAPAGVVALCGDSGVGKSTLAHVLAARGHELWADDAVAFERRRAEVMAIPLPFRPMLLPATIAAFGPPTSDGRRRDTERRLACLVVLERASRGAPRIGSERLVSASALEAAIDHAYCYRPDDLERNRRMMREYLELVARVPVFKIRFVEDMEQVVAVAERVEELLESVSGAS